MEAFHNGCILNRGFLYGCILHGVYPNRGVLHGDGSPDLLTGKEECDVTS